MNELAFNFVSNVAQMVGKRFSNNYLVFMSWKMENFGVNLMEKKAVSKSNMRKVS